MRWGYYLVDEILELKDIRVLLCHGGRFFLPSLSLTSLLMKIGEISVTDEEYLYSVRRKGQRIFEIFVNQ